MSRFELAALRVAMVFGAVVAALDLFVWRP